ncbi:S41 family peptidase [Bacillus sp. NPDC077027]|uniref:S41 family peptidase n=1 Tax=Bacillus sp. NPDC077027 TaxID=3390548 RepID=UPI003CFC7EA0
MKKQMKLILLILVTAALSSAITFVITKQGNVNVSGNETFGKLMAAYSKVKNEYYEKTDDDKLVDGAIQGMIASLDDPYSTYMDQEEAEGFNNTISSSFEGIGAQVEEKDGQIFIVAPIKGSPAEKAGLKAHDRILEVDGKSTKGMSVNKAVSLIRGKKGTDVKLHLSRDGVGNVDVTITRDTIPLETVYTKLTKDKIAEIQITSFAETTSKELDEAIRKMEDQGAKGYVIDLRDNPGGVMDEAIKMSNDFIDKGKVIMQVEEKGKRDVYKAENERKVKKPTVVIVNDGSASAAEIMAAALNQSSDIQIVGEKTFGKGTVQNAQNYNDGSSVKLTIAKWLTPNGTWIHKKGIEPQVKVSLPSYAKLPYLDSKKVYQLNDSGDEVKAAQKMFKALGYDLTANGQFDQSFKQTIESFQAKHDLKKDGILTGDTTSVLMTNIQKKLKNNDTQLKKAIDVLKKELN